MIIQPKPTTYKDVQYKSRLEARWAVFLDNHRQVRSFEFEPLTLRNGFGWTYTPDFLINTRIPLSITLPSWNHFLLEIKPTHPSKSYETNLLTFSPPHPLFVVYGNFYDIPFHTAHLSSRPSPRIPTFFNELLFNSDPEALQTAMSYRFDLVSPPERKHRR